MSYSKSTNGKVIIAENTSPHPYFPTKEQLTETVRKLRNSNKRLRAALANKERLLASTLEERRRLLDTVHAASSSTDESAPPIRSEEYIKTQKNIQRLTQRITAIKKEHLAWHVQFRTELSLYGLFDEEKLSHHGPNVTPQELASVVVNCVHLAKNDILTAQPQQHFGQVSMHDHIIEARGVELSGTYIKLTVSRDHNKDGTVVYQVSAYDPQACQEFQLKLPPEVMLSLAVGNNNISSNDDGAMVNALVHRLILSSVNGQRQLQLGPDRTFAVRGSDPEEEMARLMGTGTQQQELDRIKRGIQMGLKEEEKDKDKDKETRGEGEGRGIMELGLIKRAVFTEVKQFDRAKHGMQLLNVRLIDELDDNGTIVVYCTDPQDNRIRFRLVLTRRDIDDLVVGGVEGQSRRGLCRLIVAQLKISNEALVLDKEQDENNEQKVKEEQEGEEGEEEEDDDDDDDDEYIYDDEDDDENEDDDGVLSLFSGPITLKSGRHVHADIFQENGNINFEVYLDDGDLEAHLQILEEKLPGNFPLNTDGADNGNITEWVVNNVFVSWDLNNESPTPILLLSEIPTVICRISTVVDTEQCEVCIFEVANALSGCNSRLEIAARRDEDEDLRLFLKIDDQKRCLQGKTWSAIRDQTPFGVDTKNALEAVLSQLKFSVDDEGGNTFLRIL